MTNRSLNAVSLAEKRQQAHQTGLTGLNTEECCLPIAVIIADEALRSSAKRNMMEADADRSLWETLREEAKEKKQGIFKLVSDIKLDGPLRQRKPINRSNARSAHYFKIEKNTNVPLGLRPGVWQVFCRSSPQSQFQRKRTLGL